MDTAETTTRLLKQILDAVHPLMAEGLHLAAVPQWYNQSLFAAMRDRDDGRDRGLIERLQRYSFVTTLPDGEEGEPAYAIRPDERIVLQRHWIDNDPQAYRTAHQRALTYWEANPDPNPFAQAQNRLYHLFFVDTEAAVDYLVSCFRSYQNERQLAAIERLLDTAKEARFYLVLLGNELVDQLDDLLHYLAARLSQLRGRWDDSLEALRPLRRKADLPPPLYPYVVRAYGHALAHTRRYVEAIEQYRSALALFEEQADTESDSATIQSERAHTMIALGDAHVELAISAGGYNEEVYAETTYWSRIRGLLTFVLSLPLVVYLSFYLGRRVWHPRFWLVLRHLDWIIARLFATGAARYSKADPILETYGDPAEAVAADEKLAYLYLTVGDGPQAQLLFARLLAEEEAPLGEYRRASVQVGLGEAYLQLQQPTEALAPLRAALPVLERYEDEALEARARRLLAEALYQTGKETEALPQFDRSCRSYQKQANWVRATSIVERLEALEETSTWDEALQERATAVIDSLPRRQYPVRFRHPILTLVRRLFFLLLPVVVFMVPLLTITLDTGSQVTPVIQFKPILVLMSDLSIVFSFSQGVTAANVARTTDADVILWLAVGLWAAYLTLSLLLGVAVIALTPLRSVQARGRAGAVHLEEDSLRVGEEAGLAGEEVQNVAWSDVSQFVEADARLWDGYLLDGSSFALVTPQQRLVVSSDTSWYPSLRQHVGRLVSSTAPVVNRSYQVWPSRLGLVYLLNILLIGLLFLLLSLAPDLMWRNLLATPYSLADLYPYLYLGLVLIPLWWGVIRPLQIRLTLKPDTHLPWWIMGAGLLLALFQVVTLFRPLLTSVNLYPPLVTLILLASAGGAVWQARKPEGRVYSAWVRASVVVVVVAVGLLMADVLWRQIRAYHYLVVGNNLRDQALQTTDPDQADALLVEAVDAYAGAISIGSNQILGIDARTAAQVPLGIPDPPSFSWLSAQISKAALQTQLGQYAEAISNYNGILPFVNQPDEVVAWRAIARESWGTTATAEGEVDTQDQQYTLARNDLDQAIELNPDKASYYLWRGVANHALGEQENALDDYQRALDIGESEGQPLTAAAQTKALVGQGWIRYTNGEYEEAQQLFESALLVEEEDPAIMISLGTVHWKLGGLADEEEEARCNQYARAADYFSQAANVPGQEPAAVAFTYRTRGQLQYLLRNCPGYDVIEQYEAAIQSYAQALALDPDNAQYYQIRGRLSYALWLNLPDEPEYDVWLYEGLADINAAYERGLRDDTTTRFRRAILDALVPRAMAQGEDYLASGAYERALAEFGLVAENRPQNVEAAFKAAQAALAAGDREQARSWIQSGIEAAAEMGNRVQLLTEAVADLEAFLADRTDVEAPSLRRQLATALEEFRAQDPGIVFSQGLTALQQGRQQQAADSYRRGLMLAADQAAFNATATAVLALRSQATEVAITDTLSLFQEAFPGLERAAADETMVEAAFKLGLIATALEDVPQAAEWYNEAVRRSAVQVNYPPLRDSRADLRDLWALIGVNSSRLLAQMQDQLPDQLDQHPVLEENGLYWRFRAWFKYGLGLSAFRLEEETAARRALQSAQVDADRAYELDPEGNAFVQTYLAESAWGWYHVVRGDDRVRAEAFEAALADYEAAVEFIEPVENDGARTDETVAAFRAGLTSVRLGDFERAADWYGEGVQLAQQYGGENLVALALDNLGELVAEQSELADQEEVEALLESLQEEVDEAGE